LALISAFVPGRDYLFYTGMLSLQPLARSFYEPAADIVAPALLGHWLVRRLPEGLCGGMIVESEAYLADDPACHAAIGKTPRNQTMFGPPGHAYVYFIYGCHYCVNAVCRPHDCGEAVLIRAIQPMIGQKLLARHRPGVENRHLTSGPAKLCQAMAITRELDGTDLCRSDSPLMIVQNPEAPRPAGRIAVGKRIGISKAAHLPLRFHLSGNEFVSRK
jgi:DNA-3-methyladenine glycosylase